MENPATWGPLETAIKRVLDELDEEAMRPTNAQMIGLSRVRRIADAAREGFAQEKEANDGQSV